MTTFDPSIFRAYDMRGTYPEQMNEDVAYAAGQAFVSVMKAKKVVVGRDVRTMGPQMVEAMIRGITDAGAHVINVGVISTEMLYFAAATLECDGGMSVTASHNPPNWSGIKFIGTGAAPLLQEGALGTMYETIKAGQKVEAPEKGSVEEHDLLDEYVAFLQKFVPANLPHLKIVANTNFGADGKIVDALVTNLPIEVVRLNWPEDGTFPKGTPDPLLPRNRVEIEAAIPKEDAQFGVAWDADADRAFFYDEKGRFFHGYYITALLIDHFLKQESGSTVVIERRLTWANQDAATQNGGKFVFSRTGHGFIKAAMRENQAIFGGETSAHYYYRDFFFCDCGLVTFLTVLGIFAAELQSGRLVSKLLDYYLEKYPISEQELNFIAPRAKEIIEGAAQKYADAEQNHTDGLSIEYPDWRCNIRMSSNEPVLRMNIEAHTEATLTERLAEVREYIESFGSTLRNDA